MQYIVHLPKKSIRKSNLKIELLKYGIPLLKKPSFLHFFVFGTKNSEGNANK